MGEHTDFVLERALDLACKELAFSDLTSADAYKVRFLSEALENGNVTGLAPIDPNGFAASSNASDQERAPGSSPPGEVLL